MNGKYFHFSRMAVGTQSIKQQLAFTLRRSLVNQCSFDSFGRSSSSSFINSRQRENTNHQTTQSNDRPTKTRHAHSRISAFSLPSVWTSTTYITHISDSLNTSASHSQHPIRNVHSSPLRQHTGRRYMYLCHTVGTAAAVAASAGVVTPATNHGRKGNRKNQRYTHESSYLFFVVVSFFFTSSSVFFFTFFGCGKMLSAVCYYVQWASSSIAVANALLPFGNYCIGSAESVCSILTVKMEIKLIDQWPANAI